jgi:hypothetical protein
MSLPIWPLFTLELIIFLLVVFDRHQQPRSFCSITWRSWTIVLGLITFVATVVFLLAMNTPLNIYL